MPFRPGHSRPPRGGRPPFTDRSTDRWLTVGGIATSLGFVVVAAASVLMPETVRHGDWLPLHLLLAGAATTAIASVAPFFSAASAAAPPADPRVRAAAILLVAGGAAAVTTGVTSGSSSLAAGGGLLFIAGCIALLAASVTPHRRSLTGHRRYVLVTYGAAVSYVLVGASLATLYVAGWAPIVEVWGSIKPAHATLNLLGFVSLMIAGTLLHFYPTVVGARIAAGRPARIAMVGLVGGPPLVAGGFAVGSTPLGIVGAVAELIGALALAANARTLWRVRARWTTDPGWHRMTIWSLTLAHGWFILGIATLGGRIVAMGADPAGWSIDPLLGPLAVGWVLQVLLGSATHLVPAVGPGDQAAHARQRAILGRLATSRLVAFQVGAGLLSLGLVAGLPALTGGGVAVLSGVILVTIGLLATAVAAGVGKGTERTLVRSDP